MKVEPTTEATKPGLIWYLITIGLLVFLSQWCMRSIPDPVPWNERDNSAMAYVMTEKWVKERLTSPSTARFPSVWESSEHAQRIKGSNKYIVTSWVDSQNRLGGTIRMNFTAEVEQIGENNWRLISLDIKER
jgi:hypothetical protein